MKVKACEHHAHHGNNAEKVQTALDTIRAHRIRVTNPRKEILAVLAKSPRPLSSEEIFSALKKGGDLVTVYRSLTTLEEIGLLRRYDFGDGVRRFELFQENHHHHYVRCRGCGEVEPFAGCEFEDKISKALARRGYQMVQHTLDVQALCSACAS